MESKKPNSLPSFCPIPVPFSSTGTVPAPVIPQTFLYWVVGQPHPWHSLQDKLSPFFQYGQDENFPSLQVQVSFYSTISSSVPLSLLSTSVRRNQDTPSTLCLDISSAKHPVSSVTNSTFHRTPEHRSSQVLCHFITKITFPPVSNNMFFISIWDVTRIALNVHISSVHSSLTASAHHPVQLFRFFLQEHPTSQYWYQNLTLSEFSREIEYIYSIYMYIYVCIHIIRHWLTQLWRLRSLKIYSQQGVGPGKPLESKFKGRRRPMSQLKTVRQREFYFTQPSYSIQAFSGLMRPFTGGWAGESNLLYSAYWFKR